MNFAMIFKVATLAILRNKTRSLLTCIGIIVGIAAVIAVMAIGKGASAMMVKEISSMGNNLVMVFPDRNRQGTVRSSLGSGETMTAGDAEAIQKELSHLVAAVSPSVNVNSQLIRENRNWNTRVSGVSFDMPDIRNWEVSDGRFFDENEQRRSSRVCVIGQTVRNNLFSEEENPIGQIIRIGSMPFKVVGILASKGANGWGQDQDDTVMAPYTTVGRVLQRSKFRSIKMMNISLRSMDDLEEAKREITALLRQRHKLADYQDNDFETRDTTEIMNTIGSVTGLMTVLLTAVAAISLLVGGIGIMNIMLVSVTERTSEIGLKKALGAKKKRILLQFLTEAAVLTSIGGIIGVLTGIGLAELISGLMQIPVAISAPAIIIAVVFSTLIGVIFGLLPATKAANLNPIDALRRV